jgi:fatty acid desaturase
MDDLYNPSSVKGNFYAAASTVLRRRLAEELPAGEVRRLHRRRPLLHFLIVGWQFLLIGVASYGLWRLTHPVWVGLLALVQGFTLFNFTVLLHEVVHDGVLRKRNTRLNRFLGQVYAFPSGISSTQFTRWHLDHHAELGSDTADPKRFHLSPKINRRWYKLLYFTPVLFFIYFRAAARETATYPEALQRKIGLERAWTILFHLGILATLFLTGGGGVMLRVYILPVFVVFPVAFMLNRLGQHYDIDTDEPAKWGTLMKPSWFWDTAYLFSSYHLEHHYFPRVPFYNLPALHRLLKPFYASIGLKPRTYRVLLWSYLVKNRAPHTNWGRTT